MIENTFIGLFIFGFGAQVGRILTLRHQARKTVEGIEALINAKWHSPQVLAVRLHRDQEAVGDVAPAEIIWSPPARMPIWLELQYHYERFRAPRLRRAR